MKNKRLTAIILAGGFGTRMDNLTKNKHKTMLSIGGFPILAHLYTQLRINLIKNIIICVGYKSENINRYLKKKIFHDSDKILKKIENFKKYDYPIVQTSKLPPHQSTSQRIYKIRNKIADDDFIFLYGDTLLKPRIKKLHQLLKKKDIGAAITLSKPLPKFGQVILKGDKMLSFFEKKSINENWVNSGWCLIRNKYLSLFRNSKENFENYFFKKMIKNSTVMTVKNNHFYLPIDTKIELKMANKLWRKNKRLWF